MLWLVVCDLDRFCGRVPVDIVVVVVGSSFSSWISRGWSSVGWLVVVLWWWCHRLRLWYRGSLLLLLCGCWHNWSLRCRSLYLWCLRHRSSWDRCSGSFRGSSRCLRNSAMHITGLLNTDCRLLWWFIVLDFKRSFSFNINVPKLLGVEPQPFFGTKELSAGMASKPCFSMFPILNTWALLHFHNSPLLTTQTVSPRWSTTKQGPTFAWFPRRPCRHT